MELQRIVAGLLEDTAARGVWVLVRGTNGSEESFDQELAGATREPSIKPPRITRIDDEPLFYGEGEHGVFAQRIGAAVLVVAFDEATSLGLIRLRARKAHGDIATAIARVGSGSRRFGPN